MKYGIFFLLIVCSFRAAAQSDLAPDTVRFDRRTGGIQDTFDIADNSLPSTFDGGRTLSDAHGLSVDQLFRDMTGFRLFQPTPIAPLRYSSLPHLGFSYSFGSQGTQFLHLRYTQAFRYGFLLNFDYDRITGSGFLRNSNFTGDNVRLRVQREGQRYSMHLKGRFQSYEVFHPDGFTDPADPTISADTLIGLGLDLVPVQREGSSETKFAHIELHNFINLTNDSLNHFGLVTKHAYEVSNRRYFEFNNGANLEGYSFINYDSLRTQDSWNHPSIANGAGVYFLNKSSGFYIDGKLKHRYWNSWDIRDLRDTSEIDLASELRWKWKSINIKNSFRFNILGGFNGWEEEASARYTQQKLDVSIGALFSSLPASAIQRFYCANNYVYELNSVNRQVWLKIGGKASYQVIDSSFSLDASIRYFSIPSSYVFTGTDWQLSDTLGSASSLQLGGHARWKFLHIRPYVVLSNDRNNYLPDFQAYTRFYIKGKLFEAKKLSAIIGVDASYQNGYRLRSYVPSMDAFFWGGEAGLNPGMFNLHFFASLAIDQFRFYARFENIGYFWNDPTILEATGYPIAGTRIRVGLSWDFFN